jgi:hypothetical protein
VFIVCPIVESWLFERSFLSCDARSTLDRAPIERIAYAHVFTYSLLQDD